MLKTLNKKVDAVADDLTAHLADIEVHSWYVVKEDWEFTIDDENKDALENFRGIFVLSDVGG